MRSAYFPPWFLSRLYLFEGGLYHRNACSANTSSFRTVTHLDDFRGSSAEHTFVENGGIGGTSSHDLTALMCYVPPSG